MKEETLQIKQMNHLNLNDSTSDLDSKLSQSLVIMDCENKLNSNTSNLNKTPKGILKKSNNVVQHETGRDYYQNIQEQNLDSEPRPHNVCCINFYLKTKIYLIRIKD